VANGCDMQMLKFTYCKIAKFFIYIFFSFLCILVNTIRADTLCNTIDYKNIKKITIVAPELENGTTEEGSGIYFELLKLIYSPIGIITETGVAPFVRVKMLLTKNEIDASVSFYSSEVALANGLDYYQTPKRPINTERLIAIFKNNPNKWNFPDSLAGKRVAWMDGYDYQNGIPVNYEYQRITSQLQGLKLLQMGRIDYYLDNEYDIKRTIKKYNFDAQHYSMQLILENKLHVAFSKTQKGDKLIELFDCRMDELRESGELEKLYDKWDIPMPPKE